MHIFLFNFQVLILNDTIHVIALEAQERPFLLQHPPRDDKPTTSRRVTLYIYLNLPGIPGTVYASIVGSFQHGPKK